MDLIHRMLYYYYWWVLWSVLNRSLRSYLKLVQLGHRWRSSRKALREKPVPLEYDKNWEYFSLFYLFLVLNSYGITEFFEYFFHRNPAESSFWFWRKPRKERGYYFSILNFKFVINEIWWLIQISWVSKKEQSFDVFLLKNNLMER